MEFNEFKSKYEQEKVEVINSTSVISKPLVSVCVHTYEHAKHIRQCLDSILKQETDFDYEILLGDDNSKDGTRDICLEYAKMYPKKIKLFLHHRSNNIKINGLPTGRFNFMFNLFSTKGKYIAICEGDDYWTDPRKLQKQIDFLEKNPEVNLTGHLAQVDNSLNNRQNLIIGKHSKDLFKHEDIAYRNLRIPTASLVYRNNFEYPNWMSKVYGGDRAIIYLNSLKGDLKILDFVGSTYRIHDGGIEQSLKRNKLKPVERNIAEDYIYYNISNLSFVKKKLFKKILRNQIYCTFWSFKLGKFEKGLSSIFSIFKFSLFREI